MFREQRDDNEEAARKRWRGATSGKEVCAKKDREAAVRPSRAGRAIASKQEDRWEKKGRDERVWRRWTECVNGDWTERERDREWETVSQCRLAERSTENNKNIFYLSMKTIYVSKSYNIIFLLFWTFDFIIFLSIKIYINK